MTVFLGVGNSDDKISQVYWADLISEIRSTLKAFNVEMRGEWFSAPDSSYQNACFAFEPGKKTIPELQGTIRGVAVLFNQDAIAWSECKTTLFLGPQDHQGLNHPDSDRWTGGDRKAAA